MPGEEIQDRQQIEIAFLQLNVGDIDAPNMIHSRELVEIYQLGKSLGWLPWNGVLGFKVDRP